MDLRLTNPAQLGPSYIVDINQAATVVSANPFPGTGLTPYSGSDAATVINNAVSALPATGGKIFLRKGSYVITTPILVGDNHIIFEGEGRRTAVLTSSVSDIFQFNAQAIQNSWRDLQITSTGGHGFNIGKFGALNCKFEHLTMTEDTSSGFSAFKKITGASARGMFYNTFRDIIITGNVNNTTTSPIDLTSNIATSGTDGINQNIFDDVQIEICGRAGIWIDEAGGTSYAFGNSFRNVTGDPCTGGLFQLNSVQATILDAPNVFDTSSPTAPMVLFSKTTGLAPKGNTIRGMYSRAGTGAQPDIKMDGAVSGGGTVYDHCDVGQVDLGAWPSSIWIGDQNAVTTTFANVPATFIQLTDGTITIGSTTAPGLGIPVTRAVGAQTLNTNAAPTTLSFTPPATAGIYRFTGYLNALTAGTMTFKVKITYKDAGGNAVTDIPGFYLQNTTTIVAGGNTANTAGRYIMIPYEFSINNGATAITIQDNAGTYTAGTYYWTPVLEQLA